MHHRVLLLPLFNDRFVIRGAAREVGYGDKIKINTEKTHGTEYTNVG
jgi:hypothetical protein